MCDTRRMEFIELLFGAPELCGCTIQLFAALMDVWAGVSTVRYVKAAKKAAKADKPRPSIENVVWIVAIAMAVTLYVITSIVLSNTRR